jgi:hypothetical protein
MPANTESRGSSSTARMSLYDATRHSGSSRTPVGTANSAWPFPGCRPSRSRFRSKATTLPGKATTLPGQGRKGVAFRLEWVVAFRRNQWSPCGRKRWSPSTGIRKPDLQVRRLLGSGRCLLDRLRGTPSPPPPGPPARWFGRLAPPRFTASVSAGSKARSQPAWGGSTRLSRRSGSCAANLPPATWPMTASLSRRRQISPPARR